MLDRAGLEAELAGRIAAAGRRRRQPLSVVVLDLSGVPDAAAALRARSKADDPVAALGGGRFAVLLAGADDRGAQAYAGRITGALGGTLHGAATRARRLDDAAALLAAAGA